MKKFQPLLYTLFIAVFTLASCVQTDDFDVPNPQGDEPNLETTPIALQAMYSTYQQALFARADDLGIDPNNPNDAADFAELQDSFQYTFEGTEPLYVAAYVISSDEGGNFFEELILQDQASNPTIGVRLLLDVSPLFTKYEFGRKIYVQLTGLSIGISNGVLTLGVAGNPFLEKIPAPLETQHILRALEVATITPLPISLADFDDSKTNLWVQISDVQFNRFDVLGDAPKTFAAEADDEFDGERQLESCAESTSTVFSTSTFADFKSLTLPAGRGSINAVLTKNFFGDAFNIVINDPSNINFESSDRCDPQVVDCDNTPVTGSVFFSDDFESYNNTADMIAAGYVVENVNGGITEFRLDEFSNNQYALVSGFNTNEDTIDTWLITPAFTLDGTQNDGLDLDIQTNFDNGKILTILISSDYSGSIADATWFELQDAQVPDGPSSGFGSFEAIPSVNLSCVNGNNVRLAFRYQGSDPTATTRYHIDNITLTGN